MFADSMLETSWAQRTRRSWTTLTSFGLQALVIGVLLMIPLLTRVGLPSGRVLPTPVSWGAPAAAAHVERHSTTQVQSNLANNVLISPRSIPPVVKIIDETSAPPQVSYNSTDGVEGSTGLTGSNEGVWKSINQSLSHVAPIRDAPAATISRIVRTSSMLQGSLIRRVDPVYPQAAKLARIQGPVVLSAIISKAGTIDHLQLVSGHPLLVTAAMTAVSQWRYKPYILNGEVIEVETQITVNFRLN